MNSKCIRDLNVRLDTIKLLGENIGRTLFAINHSSIFLDPPPRVMKLKTKINKWDLLKLKSFCTAKDTIPCLKPTNGILSHHTQDNLQTPDYCSFCPPVFTPPPHGRICPSPPSPQLLPLLWPLKSNQLGDFTNAGTSPSQWHLLNSPHSSDLEGFL